MSSSVSENIITSHFTATSLSFLSNLLEISSRRINQPLTALTTKMGICLNNVYSQRILKIKALPNKHIKNNIKNSLKKNRRDLNI